MVVGKTTTLKGKMRNEPPEMSLVIGKSLKIREALMNVSFLARKHADEVFRVSVRDSIQKLQRRGAAINQEEVEREG